MSINQNVQSPLSKHLYFVWQYTFSKCNNYQLHIQTTNNMKHKHFKVTLIRFVKNDKRPKCTHTSQTLQHKYGLNVQCSPLQYHPTFAITITHSMLNNAHVFAWQFFLIFIFKPKSKNLLHFPILQEIPMNPSHTRFFQTMSNH